MSVYWKTLSIADHVFFTPVNVRKTLSVISDHVFFTQLNVNTLENKCMCEHVISTFNFDMNICAYDGDLWHI
jgi:hypothetical protein